MDPQFDVPAWTIQDLESEIERILAIAKSIVQKGMELVPAAIIYSPDGKGSFIPLSLDHKAYINVTLKVMVKEFKAIAILTVADTYAASGVDEIPEGLQVRDIPGRVEGILVQGVTQKQLYCSKFQVYSRDDKGSISFPELPETSFKRPDWDVLLQGVFDVSVGATLH
jgi:hypothetical protein